MTEHETSALERLIESQRELTASNLAVAQAVMALAQAIGDQEIPEPEDLASGGAYLSGHPDR